MSGWESPFPGIGFPARNLAEGCSALKYLVSRGKSITLRKLWPQSKIPVRLSRPHTPEKNDSETSRTRSSRRFHLDWNSFLVAGQRTDVLVVTSAQMVTADMVPDAPGIWLYHCHISDHMLAGMDARYEVNPR